MKDKAIESSHKIWKFDHYFCPLKKRWWSPGFVLVGEKGEILKVSDRRSELSSAGNLPCEEVSGHFIPGLVNAHSHAFQYAMAGLTEKVALGRRDENFWTWREQMYQVALSVSPESLKTVASYLYLQMLRAGYSHVVEFHYLHKNSSGEFYEKPTLLGETLIEAAMEVGMEITLVPVYYRQSGFGQEGLHEQRRFLFKNVAEYINLLRQYQKIVETCSGAFLGLGVHSLRAANLEDLTEIYSFYHEEFRDSPTGDPRPFHIHIAEQVKEVEDAMSFYGLRPVQWFLQEILGESEGGNIHFVHATHLDDSELKGIIDRGVHVVLCPSTEGNLGDGFFPMSQFLKLRSLQSSPKLLSHWSIGSDSHMSLDPYEELRWLDYGVRLCEQKRNPLVVSQDHILSSGDTLFLDSLYGGRKAAGLDSQNFSLSGVVIEDLLLQTTQAEDKLSTLIYSSSFRKPPSVLSAGRWVVHQGESCLSPGLQERFSKVVVELRRRKTKRTLM